MCLSIVLQRTLCTCLLFCREHDVLTYCSVENTLYLPVVLQRKLCNCLLFCREHDLLAYSSAENTMYLPIVLQRTLCTCLLFCREHNVLAYCSVENTFRSTMNLFFIFQRTEVQCIPLCIVEKIMYLLILLRKRTIVGPKKYTGNIKIIEHLWLNILNILFKLVIIISYT